MENIKEQVDKLATDEQARSMEKFPLFSSLHEVYAVLLEEVEEGGDEIVKVNVELYNLWDSIKKNDTCKAIEHLKNLEEYTTLAISEYIQVLAMIKKAYHSGTRVKP